MENDSETSHTTSDSFALVKAEHPFDNALQDKTAQFLKNIEPTWRDISDYAVKLVTDLVPSSTGSLSGFVVSIFTLLSSPHSTVVIATLSFLQKTTLWSNPPILCRLVESDLVTNVLANIQPHPPTISGNEEIYDNLIDIIDSCIDLVSPFSLDQLGITNAVDKYNHREMIFQKAVLPSSQFVTFLISNRYDLNRDLLSSFMSLLYKFLDICPFHCPTLEFVLASPIVMAFSSCLSYVEDDDYDWTLLSRINRSLQEWKNYGPEVVQSAKQLFHTLFFEGFEDTLDEFATFMCDSEYNNDISKRCHSIRKILGSNIFNADFDDGIVFGHSEDEVAYDEGEEVISESNDDADRS
ncbi:hypothetical protein BLNAU_4968 [Blattamonas nauphoetae]|uniref:Uncharacterized protein n=1 Tax=Blattamonas nauphoetae TaxID=2049346 RepID=A0ABQ9Y8M0_9EUKA|nr:hypothetical protein BLNAU_4968 [Blattamonas nauphoetae]